ncbi:uncharacterized protein [Cicer arietinum]|uniref:Uncharacterized protein LOC101490888 n=1 Tax=Cicer arietinum TaxID=3827 RepID=A0A1S2XPM1_CICAR|nr:uncharacterized protein LOC101490888 [Cicer arietinum]
MFSSKSEQPQKTILQIKQDDKFFCRLLTKESSITNPSFRVAITVPFVWESQPGTPKYTFSKQTLPPLTPPPSYYLKNTSCKKPLKNKNSRSNLFLALFPKLNLKKNIMSSTSSSLSSSPYNYSSASCSSSDSSSSSLNKIERRRRFLSYSSSIDFRKDEEIEEDANSPTSTLCFGLPRSTTTMINSGFLGFSKR